MTKAHAFHAHVYFDEQSAEQAEALCRRAGEVLGVRVGRFHRKLVGPHPRWSCQLSDRIERLGPALAWLAENRGDLTVFTHLVTDDDLTDHTQHAIWMGAMLQLDLRQFLKGP